MSSCVCVPADRGMPHTEESRLANLLRRFSGIAPPSGTPTLTMDEVAAYIEGTATKVRAVISRSPAL